MSILIDDDKHYHNHNLLEQYCQRPAILQSFGWRSMHVFAKDWLQHPEKVMEQILKRIKEAPEEIPDIEEIPDEIITEPIVLKIEPGQPVALPGFEDVSFERFVLIYGTSNKFWEAGVKDDKLIIRFGRIGTKGQAQVKTFADIQSAIKEKDKAIREKVAKGYTSEK